ncbi:hypothetical protein RV18_GL001133 [Enterococcus termitis]|nr:hypothetical protein RV18_GL001133 [Enterococcus termitis]
MDFSIFYHENEKIMRILLMKEEKNELSRTLQEIQLLFARSWPHGNSF